MTLRRLCLAAAFGLLALAPAASAATTFDLGPGVHPDVSVDDSGVGHFVWDQTQSGDDLTVYCQVPVGATACSVTKTFALPLETIGRSSYVFTPSPGRVVVVSSRCCTGSGNRVFAMTSTDGGQNFGAPVEIGTADLGSGAVFGPGEAIFGGRVSTWQRMPLTGPKATTTAQLPTGFGIPTSGTGAIFGGTTPVVAYSDLDNISSSRWTGAGDVNDASTWNGPNPVGPGDIPQMAGGPGGVAMIYPLGPSGGPYQLMARHFDGTSWGAPVPVSESGDPIFPDLSENPVSGELTALWVDNRTPNKWTISRSTDGGLTWSTPTPIVTGDDADNQFNIQVSAGPDSKGFAVSDGQSNGNIKAAPLTPLGSPGGTPAPVDSVVVGGVQVTLIAPTTCITPPEKVTLRVTSKTKKKLSPTKRVRITLAVFSLDKKKVKDKKSAFKGAFATTGFVPGSAHPAKATVTLKPIKGKAKAKKKTLKGNVTICG